MKQNELDKAESYLRRALEGGVKEAQHNLDEIEKKRDNDQRRNGSD